MPRPRTHDLDRLLDVAERLVARGGPERLTVRGLATAAQVSNGVIYHAFGSRPVLLGEVWRRAAHDYLDLQTQAVDSADGDGLAAVLAAADASAVLAARRPEAARVLMYVRRARLIGSDVPAELAEAMRDQDRRLLALLTRLANGLWGRTDGPAVETVMMCVVDLPMAVFRRELTSPSPAHPVPVSDDSRARLAAAVRSVVAIEPPHELPGPPSPWPA